MKDYANKQKLFIQEAPSSFLKPSKKKPLRPEKPKSKRSKNKLGRVLLGACLLALLALGVFVFWTHLPSLKEKFQASSLWHKVHHGAQKLPDNHTTPPGVSEKNSTAQASPELDTKTSSVSSKALPNKTPAAATPPPSFDFYTVLPKRSATALSETKSSSGPSAPSSMNYQVVLENSEFKTLEEADRFRGRLLLLGFSPIANRTNGGTYRVDLGAFGTVHEADLAHHKLLKSGFENTVAFLMRPNPSPGA